VAQLNIVFISRVASGVLGVLHVRARYAKAYEMAVECLGRDIDAYLSFHDFPCAH
jgi:hypothetical protein